MKALSIVGRTSDDDVRWLAEQAATRHTIIELGPYQGRSTRALADASPGVVYAIDNWNASINNGRPDVAARQACYTNLADLIESGRVVLLERDSQLGSGCFADDFLADMLWIDAEHTYEAVRSDIRAFDPLVKAGGLVCGHDYSHWHPGVVQAVDEAYGDRVQTLGIHRSIWWVNV